MTTRCVIAVAALIALGAAAGAQDSLSAASSAISSDANASDAQDAALLADAGVTLTEGVVAGPSIAARPGEDATGAFSRSAWAQTHGPLSVDADIIVAPEEAGAGEEMANAEADTAATAEEDE